MTERCVIILAAGQGTRMRSSLPKVLHEAAGLPLLGWCVEAALEVGAAQVVVVLGHGREQVSAFLRSRFGEGRLTLATQEQQRGTADAVRAGLELVGEGVDEVLITYGDTPAVPPALLRSLCDLRAGSRLALATMVLEDPTGYGRILRAATGAVRAIREHKDCSPEERAVREVNPGLYCVDAGFLRGALGRIGASNAQGEFYLTDLVALAHAEGGVRDLLWRDSAELGGVNDRADLALLEALLRARILRTHRRAGVTIAEGARIDRDVELAPDCTIEAGATLRGRTRVAAGARVDVGCVLTDAEIGEGALLKPYTVVERSKVGAKAQLGPFANLRPDSVVHEEAHVGNFVELKKTQLGRGAKANHLAYLGDGVVGEGANIGAGTIFCNYDGSKKHTTTVEAGAFVGSNSSLVAPITVGAGAYVASGSVLTRDVPADALALARARQENKEGYASKLRALKKK